MYNDHFNDIPVHFTSTVYKSIQTYTLIIPTYTKVYIDNPDIYIDTNMK